MHRLAVLPGFRQRRHSRLTRHEDARTTRNKYWLTGAGLLAAVACFGDNDPELATDVRSAENARVESFDWGQLITYYAGESYSTTDALSAVAIIKPGRQIHPPHVHSEEEYLMVLEGEGTWSVEGREFPAGAGDMLYAAPWDEHGISNTGIEPLKFVVFKWNPKPVSPQAEPPR